MKDSYLSAQTQLECVSSAQTGGHYQCRVWCPPADDATGRLPVIYVLDGDDFFFTLAETVARLSRRGDATGVGRALVVGISRQAENKAAAIAARHHDLTPTAPADEALGGRDCGGANAFLDCFEGELCPLIEAKYAADPSRRILFGHSLAGFFALYALASRPQLFSGYLAVSPSVWWNPALLFDGFKQLPTPASQQVFLAAGEWEGELPPWQAKLPTAAAVRQRRAQRDMLGRAQQIADALQPHLGDRLDWRLFAEEDHASVVLVALARGLRHLLPAN